MSKDKKYKVGVFDSGVGGLSVANAIEKHLPNVEVDFINDKENVPYGDKTPETIYLLVVPILQKLVDDGCQIIVIACNTVTTNLIDKLREVISVPLIGMEPMVKTAVSRTHTGIIAVCATPATLASERYKWLVDNYAKNVSVIEPDCSNWSRMIEASEVDQEFIKNQIDEICDQKADVIVLGCTHYHWIEDEIRVSAAGRAIVLQPEQSVIRRLVEKLNELE